MQGLSIFQSKGSSTSETKGLIFEGKYCWNLIKNRCVAKVESYKAINIFKMVKMNNGGVIL